MAIGIVSDDDFERELDHAEASPTPDLRPAQSPLDSEVRDLLKPGRKKGDTNVPEELRKILGEESVIHGRKSALELASKLGVSNSSVSAYANGANSTTTYHKKDKELLTHLNSAKLRLANKARHKLSKTLEFMTEGKMEGAKLYELAGIARAMAGVIKDMTPTPAESNSSINVNGPSIIMYNPGFQSEDKFDTIDMTGEDEIKK